jgi:hypothetical protein
MCPSGLRLGYGGFSVAARGSSKALSVEQEEWVAMHYGGVRSASSGAADNDQGDVRTDAYLIECKLTGRPGAPAKSTLLKQFEKNAREAYSEGRDPVLCLRFFAPDSPLSNHNGWVDLTVRLTNDDIELSEDAWKYRGLT